MANSLDEARAELGDIDAQLLALIKRRQEAALRIGAIKRTQGRATRDFSQEATVIGRARANAEAIGLDGKIAEELMLLLIRASLSAQEQDRVAKAESGEGKRALLIGGAGKMGRWFARFLHSQGYFVEIADPSGPVGAFVHHKDWRDINLDHEIIVVATPLGISSEILAELAVRKPTGVVFDVGSLKSPLRDSLRALADAGVSVTSVHPMFGPDTNLLSGRHVIFIDLGCRRATTLAKELFSSTMATLVDMDLESHDRLIAYVLGLSHALNLAFITALADSGEEAPRLAKLSSTTFDAQLDLASKVTSENPKLYFEIQSLNDYGSEALTALLYSVERIRSLVRANDEAGFVALMEKSVAYLKERSG
ncbi:MAG: prephenate dehydrogenase/arogenate dehydrogenase family protein [Kofleriaceae bacterium]|nr:prephenate dehydrogenase/arogenate dehydrogenase family protein [Kofleriaceae bacterium]